MKEPRSDLEARINDFRNMENYADQMREELSRFLLECAGHDMNSSSSNNVGIMLRMVTDLEDITDDCFSLIMLLDKAAKRELEMDKDELESLVPYTQLVEDFLAFVKDNINRSINEEQLVTAGHLEESIDEFRGELKKKSRKRLQKGADVKAELLFIDLIRHIEKIGDRAFNVTRGLREIR